MVLRVSAGRIVGRDDELGRLLRLLDDAEAGRSVVALVSGDAGVGKSRLVAEATRLAATGRKGRVRARVWQDALAAHQAGRVRVAEVRAADFVGPGAQSAMGERIVRHVRQGKNVSVLGRADRPHTWSFTDDVARMLVTAGTDPRASGHAWHVPSNDPLSQRQVIDDFARAAGVGQVRVGEIPSVVLRGMGLFWPLMRELRETEYQFRDDFVMDSSAAQATFGLKPAPWEEIVAVTVGSASR